jgi:hypothetical protein
MNFDINLLKKLNKYAIKWLMTTYVLLSFILFYKIYRNISNSLNWDDITHSIQALFYSIGEVLDSID